MKYYALTADDVLPQMWLLSTDRAELCWFDGPESVPGGYAILSHVWEGQEQTFKDIQDLHARCAKSSQNPRDLASRKIRQCCIIAERYRYKWIWDDTCCINKESSAELSEAINSMFRYYSMSSVCFAFLFDVSPVKRRTLVKEGSLFRKSKWHRRGWTLQELIAPPFLIFLSNDWNVLGTKMDLAETLEEITKVPVPLLQMARSVNDFSIACRMSWAANRETTRAEDISYCLMGIFAINMPALYGEGERAFLRLQEEIMKQSPDTSLFIWNDGSEGTYSIGTRRLGPCDHTLPRNFLFAPSPKVFSRSTAVLFSSTLLAEIQYALDVSQLLSFILMRVDD